MPPSFVFLDFAASYLMYLLERLNFITFAFCVVSISNRHNTIGAHSTWSFLKNFWTSKITENPHLYTPSASEWISFLTLSFFLTYVLLSCREWHHHFCFPRIFLADMWKQALWRECISYKVTYICVRGEEGVFTIE